MTGKLFKHLI